MPASNQRKCLVGCGYFLYWLPRVLVPSCVVWGAFSHIMYAFSLPYLLLQWLSALIGVISAVASMVAYCQTWYQGPGSPLQFDDLHPFDHNGNDMESQAVPEAMVDCIEAKSDGRPRFCAKCNVFKPDRTHHCRQCNMCVLRMDHHCIWFSCCIGLQNHKYFLQFLWYSCVLSLVAMLTAIPLVIIFINEGYYKSEFISVNFVLYMCLAVTFTLILVGFGGYSTYNAAKNFTTLETMEPISYRTQLPANKWRYRNPPSRKSLGNVYDFGTVHNMNQIMGTTWIDWLLPLKSNLPVDGRKFPINEDLRAMAEERAATEIGMHQRKQRWLEEHGANNNP